MLVLWNPKINDLEFDRELSFSYERVGIHILQMGFWNSHWNPEVHLVIKNNGEDTITFNVKSFKLVAETDTLTNSNYPDSIFILSPTEDVKLRLKYEYHFENYKTHTHNGIVHEIPQPTLVYFIFADMNRKDSILSVPTIEFTYAYKNLYRTQFAD